MGIFQDWVILLFWLALAITLCFATHVTNAKWSGGRDGGCYKKNPRFMLQPFPSIISLCCRVKWTDGELMQADGLVSCKLVNHPSVWKACTSECVWERQQACERGTQICLDLGGSRCVWPGPSTCSWWLPLLPGLVSRSSWDELQSLPLPCPFVSYECIMNANEFLTWGIWLRHIEPNLDTKKKDLDGTWGWGGEFGASQSEFGSGGVFWLV